MYSVGILHFRQCFTYFGDLLLKLLCVVHCVDQNGWVYQREICFPSSHENLVLWTNFKWNWREYSPSKNKFAAQARNVIDHEPRSHWVSGSLADFQNDQDFHQVYATIHRQRHVAQTPHLMCGSRKYPYPLPPRKIIGNSEGEGVFKGSNFRGVGGCRGKLLFQRVTNRVQNIESNIWSIWSAKTYSRTLFCSRSQYSWPLR